MSSPDKTILSVRNVKKHFPIKEGVFQNVVGQVHAVDGVSFDIEAGETIGLVGESGCGKTTIGRCVAGLETLTEGNIYFDIPTYKIASLENIDTEDNELKSHEKMEEFGKSYDIAKIEGDLFNHYRRNCQMVFQDSFASLSPRQLVSDIVSRPLKIHNVCAGDEIILRTINLLEQVGLGRQHLYRFPHQFSGGQRQRVSIARALALDPKLIILDEPTSALDVSVQAQILNLLHDLQEQRGLAYLFITHNLSVIRHMADKIVVMYLGKVVEAGKTEDIFANPQHPYTKALLAASPDLVTDVSSDMAALEGSIPDPARPPQGCSFRTRCPVAQAECGWEVDDIVRRLEHRETIFTALNEVNQPDAFNAEFIFNSKTSANELKLAMESDDIPTAMKKAIKEVTVNNEKVSVAFEPAHTVSLRQCDNGSTSRCVLVSH